MILFEEVSKSYYTGQQALQNISFRLEDGEMVYLRGRSGAGKSSLLKLINLVERPSMGRIMVDDISLGGLSERGMQLYRRRIGMIFQDYRLINSRTVYDNVALPLVICGRPPEEVQKRAMASLDLVGLLEKRNYYPLQLSGGEQQRVGIARAVVNRPRIILADEPTGNLDHDLSLEILKLFLRFNRSGVTVIIATHDNTLVSACPRRQLVLESGRLIQDIPAAAPQAAQAGGSAS
ncbi:MAG: cell division ATP-binding protein FtsE [Succinivibrionaceae bacterium]|nr:cell division ATP-binding protein FtsE [Succinivibrionaceae bacterium]MDD6546721.1 cell division ATP-binding protein FtsE [Pseudomonadota bacterium]MDY6273621.1 cell division ATP-binding protein FtsE [Succinivibrionaceae bacterium]MDY6335601.1 cell division ATP-binding protein FtsE [Succinivibrionaceae bacterium]MDY6375844.1 cell division ATP-binding protein FtsE [Succinivibrionaceae bacterium]